METQIMIPYNFDDNFSQSFDKNKIDNISIYILPFWYDYPTSEQDGKINRIYSREIYTSHILKIQDIFSNNKIILFLNKNELIENEVLIKYYINFLKIKNFIVKNQNQYEQIKKYLNDAKILYLDKDFSYNINEEKPYFFPKEISSNSSKHEIEEFLQKINKKYMEVTMKNIIALIDSTYGINCWEQKAQSIYKEYQNCISIFAGGAIMSNKYITIKTNSNETENYYFRNFNTGFIDDIPLYISNNCGIDVASFKNEYIDIVKRFNKHPKVYIDGNCSLILPFDKEIDNALNLKDCQFCNGIKSWESRKNTENDTTVSNLLQNIDFYKDIQQKWKEKIQEIYNIETLELEDSFYVFEEDFNFLISIAEIIDFDAMQKKYDYNTLVFEPICGLYKNEYNSIQSIEKFLSNIDDSDTLKAYYFINSDIENFDAAYKNCLKDIDLKQFNWECEIIKNNTGITNDNSNDYIEFIIPYCNTTDEIKKCIAQNIEYVIENTITHKPHFILVCDGFDDEEKVKKLTEKYKDYILYLNTNGYAEASGARNLGLDNASGRRIVIWDADDLITDKFLADELYDFDKDIDLIFLNLYNAATIVDDLSKNYKEDSMTRICVNKELIDLYNWRYPKLYKEDDTAFYNLVGETSKKIRDFKRFVGIYNYALYTWNDNNLCSSGNQNYGYENAMLTNISTIKMLLDKAIEIDDKDLFNKSFNNIIQQYEFWLDYVKDRETNWTYIFDYTINLLCKIYNMDNLINNIITDEQIQNLFNKMIDDNPNNEKTINFYKKIFNIDQGEK